MNESVSSCLYYRCLLFSAFSAVQGFETFMRGKRPVTVGTLGVGFKAALQPAVGTSLLSQFRYVVKKYDYLVRISFKIKFI